MAETTLQSTGQFYFQFFLVFFDMTTMEEGEAFVPSQLPRHNKRMTARYAWGQP